MPKKLSTNTKAVAARERKDEKAAAEKEKLQREKEDALWRDDDKKREKKVGISSLYSVSLESATQVTC